MAAPSHRRNDGRDYQSYSVSSLPILTSSELASTCVLPAHDGRILPDNWHQVEGPQCAVGRLGARTRRNQSREGIRNGPARRGQDSGSGGDGAGSLRSRANPDLSAGGRRRGLRGSPQRATVAAGETLSGARDVPSRDPWVCRQAVLESRPWPPQPIGPPSRQPGLGTRIGSTELSGGAHSSSPQALLTKSMAMSRTARG